MHPLPCSIQVHPLLNMENIIDFRVVISCLLIIAFRIRFITLVSIISLGVLFSLISLGNLLVQLVKLKEAHMYVIKFWIKWVKKACLFLSSLVYERVKNRG